MMKIGLSYFTDTHLTVLGLILFLFVFCGSVFITFHRGRKGFYSELQNLPLDLPSEKGTNHERQ